MYWTVERQRGKWRARRSDGMSTQSHKTKRDMKIEIRMIEYGESRESQNDLYG